jgi:simple sugar transport system ATP-binding protein
VFPFIARRSAENVGGSRLGCEGPPFPFASDLSAQAKAAWRQQRKAQHIAENRSVAVPADGRPGGIFGKEDLLQLRRFDAGKTRRKIPGRQEKCWNIAGSLEAAAFEIIPPAVIDDAPPAREAVELKRSEIESAEMVRQPPLLLPVDQIGPVAETVGQVFCGSVSHIVPMLMPCMLAAADALAERKMNNNPASQTGADAQDFTSIVRLEGVQKFFGPVQALRDIDLSIGRNEIVGLIGDNGAGKSTLIKVMTGVLEPTAGRIYVRDREIDLADYSVRMAHDLSIETVYQDRSLAEKQPLWRNFFVGRQITNRFGFIDVRAEKSIAEDILKRAIGFRGAGITVDSTVANLSGGERQGIAIGRAMHYNADLIILDEPTVALAVKEVRKVLDFVRRIKDSGRAAIYIEHNLAHVHGVADRLIVLDRGRIVAEIVPKDMSVTDLTEFLIALQQDHVG